MSEFLLPVTYKGKELNYPARLLNYGYIYKIEVEVGDIILHFERDDERNWRVLLSDPELMQGKKLDKELIEQMLISIELIT